MFIGGMILGAVLILALAWFIFIFAGRQESQSMKVIGYIIVGLLVAVVIFGPMFGSHMMKGKGGMGGGGMSCPMMSGGGMSGGGMMSGEKSGGMSCPMMSGGGMGGMGSMKEDPNMIPVSGMVMNGKNGAMLKVPMVDQMRDNMMKSDFFIEAFAKSAMEKPEFLAKLKAQIAKAEEDAKKMNMNK